MGGILVRKTRGDIGGSQRTQLWAQSPLWTSLSGSSLDLATTLGTVSTMDRGFASGLSRLGSWSLPCHAQGRPSCPLEKKVCNDVHLFPERCLQASVRCRSPCLHRCSKKPMKLYNESVTSEHDLSTVLGPTWGWALSHASLYNGLAGLIIFQGTGFFSSRFWIHPPISIASSSSKDIA